MNLVKSILLIDECGTQIAMPPDLLCPVSEGVDKILRVPERHIPDNTALGAIREVEAESIDGGRVLASVVRTERMGFGSPDTQTKRTRLFVLGGLRILGDDEGGCDSCEAVSIDNMDRSVGLGAP